MKDADYEAIQPDLFYSSAPTYVVPGAVVHNNKAYASFTRQELSFEYFDKLTWFQRRNCKLYSFESLNSGKRMFLVAEFNKFCLDYFKSSEYRHVYEIIRDGFPCRLYFDLEFPVLQNLTADGDALTKKWIQLVVNKLYQLYKEVIVSHNVVVLDSCTPEKYSKHVTLRLFGQTVSLNGKSESTELLLPDNLEIGYILNLLLMDITSSHEYTSASFTAAPTSHSELPEANDLSNSSTLPITPLVIFEVQGRRRTPLPEHCDMFLLNKDGVKRTCFVDLGVYTRNRAFRLFYSCKYGKTKRLEVKASDVKTFQMKLDGSSSSSGDLSLIRRDWLSQSLVVPYDLFNGPERKESASEGRESKKRKQETEDVTIDSIEPAAANDDAPESLNPMSYLSCINSDKYTVLPSLNPEGSNTSGLVAKDRSTHRSSGSSSSTGSSVWRSNEIARSSHNRDPSWFPALDEYITVHCASVGGVKGALNGWSLTATSSSDATTTADGSSFTFYKIKYQVLYNKYCANIQRPHKSNGIMLEVDLIQRSVVQSCWDSDCRGFKSPPVYLPEYLIPEVSDLQSMVLDYQINQAIKQKPHEWQAVL